MVNPEAVLVYVDQMKLIIFAKQIKKSSRPTHLGCSGNSSTQWLHSNDGVADFANSNLINFTNANLICFFICCCWENLQNI